MAVSILFQFICTLNIISGVNLYEELIGMHILADSYFVVVCDGSLYLFKDEQQRKAEKAISLFGYTQYVLYV